MFREENRIQLFNENIYSCCAAYSKNNVVIIAVYGYFARSRFNRFSTMLEPGPLAPFVGFTQVEVKRLCEEYPLDFDQAQKMDVDKIWKAGAYHIETD